MNKKGQVGKLLLAMNPLFLVGVLVVSLILIFLAGFFARFIIGVVLFILGILQINKNQKREWIPYVLIITGALLVLNPYGFFDNLSVVV